ncbi:MAG: ParB/RepB/Spo0J family partition protein [Butyrivibrio sp.]|uniref:ParB/RepB/Spo0J family partition protein n=1 Tax=Butyrivibrio sp. TaxID=28121 RepID=UPI001B19E040|nr:ParB/RepB/Spo0J family partition protein [Butyrivibrio sp.]MBO6241432.1 ParB/RepB/Spo0J family partition protein [Butyrivibrio sp.]
MAKKQLQRQKTESFSDIQNDVLGAYVANGTIEKEDLAAIQDIALDKLVEFKGHPFYVIDNEEMAVLVSSIKDNGVLVPIIVRFKDGKYEIISGHRRCFAAKKAGLEKVPAIVKKYTDEEATLTMVDSNIQREDILPSEKAWAYRMKKEALDKTSQRGKRAANPEDVGTTTRDRVSDTESGATVDRYIRLTYLTKDLLDLVDQKKLSLVSAVPISSLTKTYQKAVKRVFDEEQSYPTLTQANQILELSKEIKDESKFELEVTRLFRKKNTKRTFKLSSKDVQKYFPDNFDDEKISKTIYELLTKWSKEKGYYNK